MSIPRPAIASAMGHALPLAVSGLLLLLAFPPFGWAILAHVALAPAWLLCLRAASWKAFFAWAYLTGFLWWLLAMSYVPSVTVGGYFFSAFYHGLYFPLSLLAGRALVRRYRWPGAIALPAAWVSLEFLRGVWPAGGFAWFMIGHTQAPYLPTQGAGWLVQTADLGGEHAVSLIVCLSNGVIGDLLSTRWFVPVRGASSKPNRALMIQGAAWLCVLGFSLGYGAWRVAQTDQVAQPGPLVCLIQTNVPQSNKSHPKWETLLEDWQALSKLTLRAADEPGPGDKPDLIVWPETVVPFAINPEAVKAYGEHDKEFVRQFAGFHEAVGALAKATGAWLIVGAQRAVDFKLIPQPKGGTYPVPGRFYNSAYLYNARGEQVARYDKTHRMPFGEFIPWVDGWPWLKRQVIRWVSPHEVDYTVQAGEDLTILEFEGRARPGAAKPGQWRAAAPICIEDSVARLGWRMVFDANGQRRADLMVNLTNDGWYAGTKEPWQHLQVAVLRCIETRTPMARAVNTGVTGFIDSAGRVGPCVREFDRYQQVEGFVATRMSLDPRVPPVVAWRQAPMVFLAIATASLVANAAWQAWRSSRISKHVPASR